MASFSTGFGLCSITESKGLLGVSGDDEGCAVITLGKSMIIRCRLCDKKQLNSWSTALSKLTSKVVWNAVEEKFVGVFDNVYIKQWSKEDSSLEKTKKHKFVNEIHEILVFSKDSILKKPQLIVLFKNGSVRDLESALNNRKEPMKEVIQPLETIELADIIVHGDEKYLIMVTKFENKYRQCYCVELDENWMATEAVTKMKLRRQGSSLLGFTTLAGEKESSVLTLWSDGFLYSLGLPLAAEKAGVGRYLGAINLVSKKAEVWLEAVGKDRIAIYGAHPSEEGAFLGIYNIKFGVIQAQTSFKMFNNPPRMWLIESNLVTVMGQRLVCIPFNLQTETLSALVGSRALHADLETHAEICTIIPTVVWDGVADGRQERAKEDCPERIRQQLETYASEGWSEFGICQALMSELIEGEDVGTLSWCLENLTDIPERFLVEMVRMGLRGGGAGGGRGEFVGKVVRTPMSRGSLMRSLREVFELEDCLRLVSWLAGLLGEGGPGGGSGEGWSVVLEWAMAVVDAFYQQLVLSKDARVSELLVLLRERVQEEIACVNELKELMPPIARLLSGKEVEKKPGFRKSYYLEVFRLYE